MEKSIPSMPTPIKGGVGGTLAIAHSIIIMIMMVVMMMMFLIILMMTMM